MLFPYRRRKASQSQTDTGTMDNANYVTFSAVPAAAPSNDPKAKVTMATKQKPPKRKKPTKENKQAQNKTTAKPPATGATPGATDPLLVQELYAVPNKGPKSETKPRVDVDMLENTVYDSSDICSEITNNTHTPNKAPHPQTVKPEVDVEVLENMAYGDNDEPRHKPEAIDNEYEYAGVGWQNLKPH